MNPTADDEAGSTRSPSANDDPNEPTPGKIRTVTRGDLGELIVDNPRRHNAMAMAMYEAVPAAVTELVEAGVRVIVVTGAGSEAFSAGSDISEFTTRRRPDNWRTYAEAEHRAHVALRDAPVPTVAKVRGHCRGGGLALALCADLRVAATDATFAVPPGRLGVGYPPDGLAALASVVGVSTAKELVFTARTVDAAEAAELGLVNRVVDRDRLDDVVGELAATVAAMAPLTLRAAKLALTDLTLPASDRSADAVEAAWEACYRSDDYAEGVRAFAEKRRPRFRGR